MRLAPGNPEVWVRMVLVVVSAKSAKLMAAPEVVRMPPNVVGPTEWVRPPCRSIAVVVVAPKFREPVL